MKEKWLQVAVIAMAIALVFTIVTSNVVSLTAISALRAAKDGGSKTVVPDSTAPVTNAVVTNAETQAIDSSSATAAVSDTQAVGTTSSGSSGTTGSNTGTTSSGGSSNTGSTITTQKTDTNMPSTKEQVFDFYKTAINKVKSQGAAGHTRKEWQSIDALDLPGGALVKPIIESFVKDESKAEESVSAKGSKEAKDRMAPCGAPITRIKSAVCVPSGNNYKITIVMNDEVNPEKGSNGVAAMATGILYMEDVKNTVANDATVSKVVKSLNEDSKITYKAYTITAEMTKDGKFIKLDHVVSGDIVAGAQLVLGSINGTGTLTFHSSWYKFQY